MKVLKFGGTSVGTAESLTNVKQIVTACKGQVIVVVSALGGVTNQLIQMADLAEAHSDEWESILEQVKARHMSVIDAVVPEDRQAQCKTVIEGFISEGLYSYYAMLYANNQLPPAYKEQLRDAIVSHGEIMSSAIVASMIDGAVPHYAPNFIKTKDVDYERILDNASFELITKEFAGRLEQVHVTQGFIAEDSTDGKKTNLGRTDCRRTRCRGFGDLDRCRWFYDCRSSHQPRCHRHSANDLRASARDVRGRSEGYLHPHPRSCGIQAHSRFGKEHFQSLCHRHCDSRPEIKQHINDIP